MKVEKWGGKVKVQEDKSPLLSRNNRGWKKMEEEGNRIETRKLSRSVIRFKMGKSCVGDE